MHATLAAWGVASRIGCFPTQDAGAVASLAHATPLWSAATRSWGASERCVEAA